MSSLLERMLGDDAETDDARANTLSLGIHEGSAKLKVKLCTAKHLPKMDLFRTCDAYCTLYLDTSENVGVLVGRHTRVRKKRDILIQIYEYINV